MVLSGPGVNHCVEKGRWVPLWQWGILAVLSWVENASRQAHSTLREIVINHSFLVIVMLLLLMLLLLLLSCVPAINAICYFLFIVILGHIRCAERRVYRFKGPSSQSKGGTGRRCSPPLVLNQAVGRSVNGTLLFTVSAFTSSFVFCRPSGLTFLLRTDELHVPLPPARGRHLVVPVNPVQKRLLSSHRVFDRRVSDASRCAISGFQLKWTNLRIGHEFLRLSLLWVFDFDFARRGIGIELLCDQTLKLNISKWMWYLTLKAGGGSSTCFNPRSLDHYWVFISGFFPKNLMCEKKRVCFQTSV